VARRGNYTQIPNELTRRGGGAPGLTELGVYCYLASLNPCHPSIKGIGMKLSIDRVTVRRCITALKKDGFVQSVWHENRTWYLCRRSHPARYRVWFEQVRGRIPERARGSNETPLGGESFTTNKTKRIRLRTDAHASKRPEATVVKYSDEDRRRDPNTSEKIREIVNSIAKPMPKPSGR
jgi:hypothetical protein